MAPSIVPGTKPAKIAPNTTKGLMGRARLRMNKATKGIEDSKIYFTKGTLDTPSPLFFPALLLAGFFLPSTLINSVTSASFTEKAPKCRTKAKIVSSLQLWQCRLGVRYKVKGTVPVPSNRSLYGYPMVWKL